MTLFAFILGVLCGVALSAFIDAPVVDEPWLPPKWMQENFYVCDDGRIYRVRCAAGRFDRLCEKIEEGRNMIP